MANKKKGYDLNAADRRRNLLIQVGLTAVVILFAVGLLLLILKPWEPKPDEAVRNWPARRHRDAHPVAVPDKLVKDAAGKPKVVLSYTRTSSVRLAAQFERKLRSHG